MNLKSFAFFIANIALCSCHSPNLMLLNRCDSDVYIQFQSSAKNDPSNIFSVGTKDTLIEIPVVPVLEGDLILIAYKTSQSKQSQYLRFSKSYLKSKQWKIELPFRINDSIRFVKKEFKEEFDSFEDHSYYFLVQELYNTGQYAECIKAIESISLPILQLYGMSGSHASDFRGLVTLGYLSSLKIKNANRAESYWDILWKKSDVYTKFLIEHDLEISLLRAG